MRKSHEKREEKRKKVRQNQNKLQTSPCGKKLHFWHKKVSKKKKRLNNHEVSGLSDGNLY